VHMSATATLIAGVMSALTTSGASRRSSPPGRKSANAYFIRLRVTSELRRNRHQAPPTHGCGLHSAVGRDRPRDIGLRQIGRELTGARAGLDIGRTSIVGLGMVLLVVVVRWPCLKSHQDDDQL
jgi:hypothetical protein